MSVELRPLGEVCKTTSGGTPSRSKPHYFDGTIPWVKSGELPDGIVVDNSEYISDEAIRNSSAKLLPAGTLLVALYGATVGKLGILSRPAATNQAVCAIFPSEAIDTKFLFWYLLAKRPWLIGQAAGGAQPNISQGVVRSLMVPVMPLQAQHEIVAEIEKQFSRLDEAVANLQRVKVNLKRYKASVLKDAVEGRLVPTEAELARREGRSFETGEQLLQRILEARRKEWKGKKEEPVEAVESNDTELPDGWSWATIDQLTVVVRGGSPRPAGDPRFFGGTVPWITVGSLTADGTEYLRQVRDTLTDEGKERSRFIDPHTLLLTNSGATLGVPKISLIGGCINDGVAALLNVEYPLKLYLLHFLRTLTDSMRRINQGAAQPNLNTTIIRGTRVSLPPVPEQQRIVTEIDRQMSLLNGVEIEVDANLKRAQTLRQSILAKAFGTQE